MSEIREALENTTAALRNVLAQFGTLMTPADRAARQRTIDEAVDALRPHANVPEPLRTIINKFAGME